MKGVIFMKQLFNNFKLFKIDDPENDRPFMAACRDQEAKKRRTMGSGQFDRKRNKDNVRESS